VRIFFVLSGFLITTLLRREQEETGGIRLKQFYMRRAYRLLPAAYLYLIVVTAIFHQTLSYKYLVAAYLYLSHTRFIRPGF
jgi:peptidoglycan/LPS O-acetylase OafA/YrhL